MSSIEEEYYRMFIVACDGLELEKLNDDQLKECRSRFNNGYIECIEELRKRGL